MSKQNGDDSAFGVAAGSALTWQPIGTEPKDGTRFLAWRKGRVVDASWYCQCLCESYPYSIKPTHWMPHPGEPNTQGQPTPHQSHE